MLGAIGVLVSAIAGAAVLVLRELRAGRKAKADPEVPGSGAAICAELKAGREEQRRFNEALALHLGMLPLSEPDARDDKVANGR